MNDLIDLKRPVSLGTPVPLWKCRFSTFWKKASNLGCSSPLRHFNNQSAIQPDGNVDWRMAWLEVIIHLEWANKPGYQAPSGGCREKKKSFFLKCKTKTCMNHVSPPAVLWCLMAFAVMRIKLVILKQPEPLSKVIVFCASCHYMSNMTF